MKLYSHTQPSSSYLQYSLLHALLLLSFMDRSKWLTEKVLAYFFVSQSLETDLLLLDVKRRETSRGGFPQKKERPLPWMPPSYPATFCTHNLSGKIWNHLLRKDKNHMWEWRGWEGGARRNLTHVYMKSPSRLYYYSLWNNITNFFLKEML